MPRPPLKTPSAGDIAQAAGRTLHSYQLGLLPIVNRLLARLRLEHFLRDYLPPRGSPVRLASGRRPHGPAQESPTLPRAPLRRRARGRLATIPDWLGLSDRQSPPSMTIA